MTTHAPSTSAKNMRLFDPLADAGNLKVNGWTPFRGAEGVDFYEQAHGVASFFTSAVNASGGLEGMELNASVITETVRAIETLIGLGMLADRNRQSTH